MINLILQKFKEQKSSIFYYAAGLFGYTLLMVSMFPLMKKSDMEQLAQSMPKELMQFFGGESLADYSTIEGFLAMEYLSFFFILIICFYLGSAAGSIIAGPLEKKTIDFELSQPISRTKYTLGQAFVGLFYSLFLVIFNATAIWLLCQFYNISIKNSGLIAFSIIATAFVWAFYGIALFFSSLLKTKLSVVLCTITTALSFFVFTSISNLIDKLKNYEKISLFYLYNPQKLLETGEPNYIHLIILLIIAATGVISSIVIFNRKDLS